MHIPFDSPELDSVLEALANQKRRGILHELSLKPDTISHLARSFELTLPAIHKHILILESANLIIRKKAGRTNFLVLNQKTLNLVQNWINQYKTEWGNSQATLTNYIARMQE
jgi:DNA-binding transcriptional ArsR family regulator